VINIHDDAAAENNHRWFDLSVPLFPFKQADVLIDHPAPFAKHRTGIHNIL
jgi:hypothetical protein